MSEEWRPVVGFNGYEVSSYGNVRSLTRVIKKQWKNGKHYEIQWIGRPLTFVYNHAGYRTVTIGNRKHLVSRLVCFAFHGSPPYPNAHADHIDHCPTNNHVENLQWLTPTENWRRRDFARGFRNGQAKVTDDVIIAIRTLWKAAKINPSRFDILISECLNLSRGHIRDVRRHKKRRQKTGPKHGDTLDIFSESQSELWGPP